jgi:hypothetical protein
VNDKYENEKKNQARKGKHIACKPKVSDEKHRRERKVKAKVGMVEFRCRIQWM